jgi:hypothetical protein
MIDNIIDPKQARNADHDKGEYEPSHQGPIFAIIYPNIEHRTLFFKLLK